MSEYVAKIPNSQGFVEFDVIEDQTWRRLYVRQKEIILGRACDEFISGLNDICFPVDRIPQHVEINHQLGNITGWGVQPVPALIQSNEFYALLKSRRFPVATFIRRPEDFDYLKEPDLFHEYFGHCTLLTNQAYADFVAWYGDYALQQPSKEARRLLLRLFWFTIEFGLFKTPKGWRIYGGGILSSPGETVYAVESSIPERRPFVLEDVLRTPYRYDVMQPIYYYLESFDDLYRLMELDLNRYVAYALEKGDFPLHPLLVSDSMSDLPEYPT
ncbi:MAG: phenylalanine 4-monooxygenase [Gammaproteobacteria bacterium]|nr:phenylalanine 4-monooxygenase [Gammaproteobacteria bacterium]MCD8543284.1 phenylalanine 4-monooxygenase [Gammaproteobacteria bacterium]MCD8573900.1 phenylalanine 4-monooxygenase [Gammaproteobacteria bacterium]